MASSTGPTGRADESIGRGVHELLHRGTSAHAVGPAPTGPVQGPHLVESRPAMAVLADLERLFERLFERTRRACSGHTPAGRAAGTAHRARDGARPVDQRGRTASRALPGPHPSCDLRRWPTAAWRSSPPGSPTPPCEPRGPRATTWRSAQRQPRRRSIRSSGRGRGRCPIPDGPRRPAIRAPPRLRGPTAPGWPRPIAAAQVAMRRPDRRAGRAPPVADPGHPRGCPRRRHPHAGLPRAHRRRAQGTRSCARSAQRRRADDRGRRHALTIGRGSDNGLVLDDARVSRHHGRLQARRGTLVYTDPGSTNGSRVNGVRVDEIALGPGDRDPARRHGARRRAAARLSAPPWTASS